MQFRHSILRKFYISSSIRLSKKYNQYNVRDKRELKVLKHKYSYEAKVL